MALVQISCGTIAGIEQYDKSMKYYKVFKYYDDTNDSKKCVEEHLKPIKTATEKIIRIFKDDGTEDTPKRKTVQIK